MSTNYNAYDDFVETVVRLTTKIEEAKRLLQETQAELTTSLETFSANDPEAQATVPYLVSDALFWELLEATKHLDDYLMLTARDYGTLEHIDAMTEALRPSIL